MTIKDLLNPSSCILIPRFQRRFQWSLENAHNLVRDMVDAHTSPTGYWAGVIIFAKPTGSDESRCQVGQKNHASHICNEIIDGQQRLATVLLWMTAIFDHAIDTKDPMAEEFNPRSSYFWLQHPDNEHFLALETGLEDAAKAKNKIAEVYRYFRWLLWLGEAAVMSSEVIPRPGASIRKNETRLDQWARWYEERQVKKGDLPERTPLGIKLEDLILTAQDKLVFLGVQLQQGDDAERIFSGLNGFQTPLTQFDFLRNYVFSKVESAEKNAFFDANWQPTEKALGTLTQRTGKNTDKFKESFLYEYMQSIGAGRQGFNANRAYTMFRSYENSPKFARRFGDAPKWAKGHLPQEVGLYILATERHNLEQFPSTEPLNLQRDVRRSLARIRLISDGPPVPLVMFAVRQHLNSETNIKCDQKDLWNSLRKLEAYLYKARMGGLSLTNLRREVINQMVRIQQETLNSQEKHPLTALNKFLDRLALDGLDRRVSDGQLWGGGNRLGDFLENEHKTNEKSIGERLGSTGILGILDAVFEHELGPEGESLVLESWQQKQEYTLEHVFPQDPKDRWNMDLKSWGVERKVMDTYTHTLGNLSAAHQDINSALSNKSFDKKKEIFREKQHPLRKQESLVTSWTGEKKWTPKQIEKRTMELVDALTKFWPDPS